MGPVSGACARLSNAKLQGLNEFCEFFLTACIDQVKFMEDLLQPYPLVERVRGYCATEIEERRLPSGGRGCIRLQSNRQNFLQSFRSVIGQRMCAEE